MNDQAFSVANYIQTGVKVEALPASKAPSKTGMSEQRMVVVNELNTANRDGTKGNNLQMIINRTQLPERAVYHHLWCMRKDGLVKSREIKIDSATDLIWSLTKKGMLIASTL